jgi:hypothetical protein
MILGLSSATLTLVHLILSLAGIGSGFVVVFGLLTARRFPFWTALFIAATALASLTGFLFPFRGMTLNIELGIPTLAVLMLAAAERYSNLFAGNWRHTYVVSVMIALYCNLFALVAQLFARYLPPTTRSPARPGLLQNLAQLAVFAVLVVLTYFALRNFHRTHDRRA